MSHRHTFECWVPGSYEPCGEHHQHDYHCGGGKRSRACPSYWSMELPEYRLVRWFYEGKSARRSDVPYMNHITEGLKVLEWIGASRDAERAYCLHPMVQQDEDLAERDLARPPREFRLGNLTDSPRVMALAMEYRSVANDYLARATGYTVKQPSEIRLSPLKDVNDMLIADKVQNYKDFLIFHFAHPHAKELDGYFKAWLTRLGVTMEMFQEFRERLT